MRKNPRKVISLFTGAGGLDLGFEAAGFETAVAVEMDDMCVQTLRHNRKWPVIHSDVHSVSSEDILEASKLKKREASLLIGGPPCQPFSKSGFWATGESKRLKDPRASTLDEYLRVLEDTLPEAFLLENVAGIAYKGKAEGLEYLLDRIATINRKSQTNYQVETMRLNAAAYGVPQIRERVFLVAHREGRPFGELKPTHSYKSSADKQLPLEIPKLRPANTTWDAIGHFVTANDSELAPRGKWADLLPSIPEGDNYLYHTSRGDGEPLFGWRRRFWNFLLKLDRNKPSWTLTAQPGPATGPFHWDNRYLSAKELAAIQTFPHDYEVTGTRIEAHKQIGNAVPSALAELLGLKMRARYFGENEQENAMLSLLPTKLTSTPKAKKPAPVPEKYLQYIGEHLAHPGTGKGYGAERARMTA
jgi:DNA (cytosine-5)-methyltransferase 1